MSVADHLPKPSSTKLEHSKLNALDSGSAAEPAITFGGEQSSGWYLNKDGEIVFTSYGEDNIIQNYDYTEFRKSIMFNDDSTISDVEPGKGLLYKKPGSSGLWWRTADGEINLTDQGVSGIPARSALHATSTVGSTLTLDNESMRVTDSAIKIFKPIEILDAGLVHAPETSVSGYLFKKPDDDNLWWKTANSEVNVTDKLPEILTLPSGSANIPTYSFSDDVKSGMFLVPQGGVGMAVKGAIKTEFKQTETVSQVPIKVPNGTATQPAFAFNSAGNTGMFVGRPGKLGMSVTGNQVLDMDSTSVKSLVPVILSDGSINNLSLKFSSDGTTGLFAPSAGNLSLVAGGNEVAKLNASGLEIKTGSAKVSNGSSQQPSYSFTSQLNTGLYYDPTGFVGITVDGVGSLKIKQDSIETRKPILAFDNSSGVPQYSFEASPATGVYYNSNTKTLDLKLADTDKSISVNSNSVKVTGPLELGNANAGRLYKKDSSAGLWWNAGGVEVDLTEKGIIQAPSVSVMPDGSSQQPSYSFAGDSETGFYKISDGRVGFSSNAKPLLSMGTDNVDFHDTPIVLHDRDAYSSSGTTSGALYKKKDSTSLWWNVNGVEVDILDKATTFPLISDTDGTERTPVYSFASDTNTGMFKNKPHSIGFSTSGTSRMSIDLQKVSFDLPLEIGESAESTPSSDMYGRLYKESKTGHLMWNSSLGQVCLTKEPTKYLAVSSKNIALPDFSFTTDTDTGMYLASDDVLGLVAGGSMGLAVSESQTILYNTVVVKDTAISTPAIMGEGHLYKKPGLPGLYWNTISGTEVDLTQVRYPFSSNVDGNSVMPVYGFTSEPGTGMFRNSSGGVGMSVSGVTQLLLNNNVASFNKPIEIKESSTSVGSAGTGRLYKKVNSDALIWNVDGVEKEISADISFPMKADDGSQLAPSYTFDSELSLGLSRTSPGVLSVVNNSAVIASFSSGQATIVPKLALMSPLQMNGLDSTPEISNGNTGLLYKKAGSNGLFWKTDTMDETNLLNMFYDSYDGGVVSKPILLPNGSQSNPAVSFISADKTGIYYNGQHDAPALSVVFDGTSSTSFTKDAIVTSNGSSALPGYAFTKNGNYGMYATSGPDSVLGLSAGGSANITMSQAFTTLQKRLRINDTDGAGTETSTNYGELYKVVGDDNLYWKPANGTAIALGSSSLGGVPKGTNTEPSYSFADAPNTGLFLDVLSRPSISKNGLKCVAFDNGGVLASSTGTLINPAYSFDGNDSCGLLLSVVGNSKSINTVINSKNCLEVYDDKVESVNPIVSKTALMVAGINEFSAGLFKISNTELGITSGKTEAVRIDEEKVSISRHIVVNDTNEPGLVTNGGYLYKKDSDDNLYWKTATSNISVTSPNCVELRTGSDLSAGSVVGFDTMTSSYAVKSIGGKSKDLQTAGTFLGASASVGTLTYARFAAGAGESVLVTLSQKYTNGNTNIAVQGTWLNDSTLSVVASDVVPAGLIVPGNLPECHCSIVEIDNINKWCIVSAVVDNGDIIYLRKIRFNVNHTIQLDHGGVQLTKNIGGNCAAYDSVYDKATDTLLCVAYVPSNMNFTACLVLANSNSDASPNVEGTVDSNLSSEVISDSNKQLHVVVLPGQVAVISYGNHKISFIAMAHDAPITQGETMIDYDSYDCVDMHFDDNEDMLICLEKTITPSCFIQAIDIIGTKMQRIASKNFKNQTMDPFGLTYNNVTGNYTLMYCAADSNAAMCYTTFTFNGDEFTVGMRYVASGSSYLEPNNFRKGKSVFSLSNRNVLGFWPNASSTVIDINCFKDGYSSYPSAFVGVVVSDAAANNVVSVSTRGSVYTSATNMNSTWIGKKLYLSDYNATFPNNLSTNANGNSFIGTCLGVNKILLGL